MRPTRVLVAALALVAMQSVVAGARLDSGRREEGSHAPVGIVAAKTDVSTPPLEVDGILPEEEEGEAPHGQDNSMDEAQHEEQGIVPPTPIFSTNIPQATEKSLPRPAISVPKDRVHVAKTGLLTSTQTTSIKPPMTSRSPRPRPVDYSKERSSSEEGGFPKRPNAVNPTKVASVQSVSSGSMEADLQTNQLDDDSTRDDDASRVTEEGEISVDDETEAVFKAEGRIVSDGGSKGGEPELISAINSDGASNGDEAELASGAQVQEDTVNAVVGTVLPPTRAPVNAHGSSSGQESKMATPELTDLSGDVKKLPNLISISSAVAGTQQYHVEDKGADLSAKGILVHFKSLRMNEGDRIVLKSNQGDQQVIAHSIDGPTWSQRLMGHAVTVRFLPSTTSGGAGDVNVVIDSYRVFRGHVTKEEACGEDDSKPVKCFLTASADDTSKYIKAQAVARVLVDGSIPCSGALLGASGEFFLTAGHCIKKDEQATSLQLEFGAESSSCLTECKSQMGCIGSDLVVGTELYYVSRDLDFAILKLKSANAKPLVAKFGFLTLREAGPTLGEELFIAHHPNAYAKRISAMNGNNKITAQALKVQRPGCGPKKTTDHIAYASDTIGGSSGAPVISSSDGRVIGVHLCGGCSTQGVNSGVSARAIVADLTAKGKLQKSFVL